MIEQHHTYVLRKSDDVLNEHRLIVVQAPTPLEAAMMAMSREVMLPYNPYAVRNDIADDDVTQGYAQEISKILGE